MHWKRRWNEMAECEEILFFFNHFLQINCSYMRGNITIYLTRSVSVSHSFSRFFLLPSVALLLTPVMCLRMGQSLRGGPHIFPSTSLFINPTVCEESGVCLLNKAPGQQDHWTKTTSTPGLIQVTIKKGLSWFIRIPLIPSTQHYSCCRLAIQMAKKNA